MKKWQTLFKVVKELEVRERLDGTFFDKYVYYIYCKHTNQKVYSKTRHYGYSDYLDACRGAAHMYRVHEKALEELLGVE